MKEQPKKIDRCVICHRNGVDGISVASGLICRDCERRIVNTESTDPGYDEVLKAIKALWKHYDASDEQTEDSGIESAQL